MVANYARTAVLVIKPFVDNYNYEPSSTFVADETSFKASYRVKCGFDNFDGASYDLAL